MLSLARQSTCQLCLLCPSSTRETHSHLVGKKPACIVFVCLLSSSREQARSPAGDVRQLDLRAAQPVCGLCVLKESWWARHSIRWSHRN